MSLMAIVDILNEIDAYLLRLRHARALLAPTKDALPKPTRQAKSKANVSKPASTVVSKPPFRENKPQSKTRVASTPQVPAFVSHQADSERLAVVPAEPTPQQILNVNVVPIRKVRASLRGARRIPVKAARGPEINKLKPAIALSGPLNRIVVVSPEQVQQQRDRDRVANSEVPRPRLPSSGLTGKLAFEALFKDAADPSKAS